MQTDFGGGPSGRLVISGPPDIVAPNDPLGAFEARKDGKLRVLSSAAQSIGRKGLPREGSVDALWVW